MTNYNDPVGAALPVRTGGPAPIFSTFSILAVVCALCGLFNVAGPGLGVLLAIAGIVFGLLGMLEAILPTRRGGIISFFATGVGLLGVLISLFRLFGSHNA